VIADNQTQNHRKFQMTNSKIRSFSFPAGTQGDALASTLDILPTIAAITGTKLPANRPIDGVDISTLLAGTATSVRKAFLYYGANGNIEGIREGDWKLLEVKADPKKAKAATSDLAVMRFNLAEDVGEKRNLAAEKPELVEQLRLRMTELDAAVAADVRPVWRKTEK
jgi:arylsulfatase A